MQGDDVGDVRADYLAHQAEGQPHQVLDVDQVGLFLGENGRKRFVELWLAEGVPENLRARLRPQGNPVNGHAVFYRGRDWIAGWWRGGRDKYGRVLPAPRLEIGQSLGIQLGPPDVFGRELVNQM